jgi:FAD-dependent urate hydroxylase
MDIPFVIIGAGSFGLAMAVQARELGIDHVVLGQPMSFWERHMPAGMVLRSGCDWHLDPTERHTFERFVETRGEKPSDVEPLSLNFYLEYAECFQKLNDIHARPLRVTRLNERDGHFEASWSRWHSRSLNPIAHGDGASCRWSDSLFGWSFHREQEIYCHLE